VSFLIFLSYFLGLKETSILHGVEFKVVMGTLQLTTLHKDLFFSSLKATIDWAISKNAQDFKDTEVKQGICLCC
jgi:hypothetical protein